MFDDYKEAAVRNSRSSDCSTKTTDILEWLKDNGPRNNGELMQLRKALYGRRTQPGYIITGYDGRLSLKGRVSTLLIVSDKARHFLLRTLCKLNGTEPRRRRR